MSKRREILYIVNQSTFLSNRMEKIRFSCCGKELFYALKSKIVKGRIALNIFFQLHHITSSPQTEYTYTAFSHRYDLSQIAKTQTKHNKKIVSTLLS